MEILLAVVLLIGSLIWGFKSMGNKTKNNANPKIPEITKVNSIRDIVLAVNHGRIYPFYTRMNLIRAKNAAKTISPNALEIEQQLQFHEMIGIAPYFDIEVSNNYIERISVTLNKNGLVSSVGINIKNFESNTKSLLDEMVLKFGRPYSMDNEFVIWREGPMVINICRDGSLAVIDETIF